MLTYRELEQLLQPLQQQQPVSNESKQSKKNVNPSQPQQNANGQRYHLPLSHRELRKVPALIPFKQYQIQSLNLSFNYLKDLKPMKQQPAQFLQYLNISFNFLVSIQKIGNSFKALKVIDANANRIVSLDLKDAEFPSLEALYLKNNKIKYFLHCPNSLEILCLDHNELEKLAFSGGHNLEILSASHNKIEQFEIEVTQNLNFIDLEQNLISDMEKLKTILSHCKSLLSLNMIGNYVSKISHKKYLVEVLVVCPKLVKVDEVMINPHVREAFKVMSEQDKMELKMKQTEQKYQMRLQEQLKLKEQMIDQLKDQQKVIEDNFANFLKNEKEQLDVLQNYAKNNMGKKVMGIVEENKNFNKMVNSYSKKPDEPLQNAIKEPQANLFGLKPGEQQNFNQNDLGNQLTKFLVEGVIISKHKDEYAQYKKNKEEQRVSKQSKIKQYLGIPQKKPESKLNVIDNKDDDSDLSDDQLSADQKQRRKKNMRNPALVYRNSNQLLGMPNVDIDADLSSEEDTAYNKKCLPYLVKKYGFHTII